MPIVAQPDNGEARFEPRLSVEVEPLAPTVLMVTSPARNLNPLRGTSPVNKADMILTSKSCLLSAQNVQAPGSRGHRKDSSFSNLTSVRARLLPRVGPKVQEDAPPGLFHAWRRREASGS